MKIVDVIPARYKSTRFERNQFVEIRGNCMYF